MSSQLTHERCSELLAAYLSGELDTEQRRLVKDHLEHCAQCSAERAGLAALRSDAEPDGLTEDERVQLRAAVLGATRDPSTTSSPLDDESDAVVVPLGGRGSRAGKYLGIAAMLAILAVGSLFVFRDGRLGVTGADDSGAESSLGTAEDSGGGGDDQDAPREDAAEGEAFRFKAGNLRPNVQSDRGVISESDLGSLGRRASVAYTLSDNAAASDNEPEESERDEPLLSNQAPGRSLDRLALRAPEPLAPELTECGQTALDELGGRGLATYATTATIEDTDVVIIAFVTGARTPDTYAVFAFPRGDCTTILASTEGPLE